MKKLFLTMILTGLFSACISTDIDSETPPWDRTDIKDAASQEVIATADDSTLRSDVYLLTKNQ